MPQEMTNQDWDALAELLNKVTNEGAPWEQKRSQLRAAMKDCGALGSLREIVGWFDDGSLDD